MTIFSDLHHSGLFFSLQLLLEKRLGHQLYRPIGLEWFERGFWDIAKPYQNNINTVKQYLSLQPNYQPVDGTVPLNKIAGRTYNSQYFKIHDEYHDAEQRAVTFQKFMDMEFDVIIASIPDHWYTYKRLRDQFQPRAKLICHMGNMFQELQPALNDGTIENLMASAKLPLNLQGKNAPLAVEYYQEQPLADFNYSSTNTTITSFVHLLPRSDLYDLYRNELKTFSFYAYGASAPNGYLHKLSTLYEKTKHTAFVWQVKPGGDGYGWNWHTAFLHGRPVITNFSDYKNTLGGRLFEHKVTGIDLEQGSVIDNAALIRSIATTDLLHIMQEKAYARFNEIVNYDNEAQRIASFLANLK